MGDALTVGSMFAGIGGFDLGLERAGAKCLWQVEKDPPAQSVLRRHWPGVALHDDVCEVGMHNLEAVDVICGGFPCQDLSVAGKRTGLDGGRSGLFFEIVRAIKEMRQTTDARYPEFAVLENVPGLLSSHGGRDFACVLAALAGAGAMDLAWAVLDAQWFGVPQRRRRVFLVADFRAERAAEILSIPYGGKGHPPPSRQKGPGTAYELAPILTGSGRGTSRTGESRGQDCVIPETAHTLRSEGADASEDGTGRGTPLIAASLRSRQAATKGVNPPGRGGEDDVNLVAFSELGEGHQTYQPADAAGALAAEPGMKQQTYLAFKESQSGCRESGVHATLDANKGSRRQEGVLADMMVRRLTPLECERLQAFPDSWTALDGNGKVVSDSARYRLLGNAVCVNVVEWIGRRLVEVSR